MNSAVRINSKEFVLNLVTFATPAIIKNQLNELTNGFKEFHRIHPDENSMIQWPTT